jgi:hypothetical protein
VAVLGLSRALYLSAKPPTWAILLLLALFTVAAILFFQK